MGSVQSRVSYLQGLAKGLSFNSQSVEGKLLLNMVEVLDSVAKEIDGMHQAQKDLEDYVDSIDEDLEHLENVVYEDEENGTVHLECPNCNAEIVFEAAELDDDDVVEVACPTCGNVVYENIRDAEYAEADREYAHRDHHPGI